MPLALDVDGVILLVGQLRQCLAHLRVDLIRIHSQFIDHMAAARVRAAIIAGSAKSHSFAAGLVLKASTGSDGLSRFHVNQISEAVTGDDHEGWYIGREGIDVGRYCEKRP